MYDLQVFPNPFRNDLTLEFFLRDAHRNLRITLFDNAGQIVLQRLADGPAGKNVVILDGSRLPSGVYWIAIQPENGPLISRKAVKLN